MMNALTAAVEKMIETGDLQRADETLEMYAELMSTEYTFDDDQPAADYQYKLGDHQFMVSIGLDHEVLSVHKIQE